MPTSLASPRYIGYAAIAALLRPKTSGKRGSVGSWSNPRSRTMLAGAAARSRRRAPPPKRVTRPRGAGRRGAGPGGLAGQRAAPGLPEHEDEPVLFHRLDEQLDAGQADRPEPLGQLDAGVRRDPAGAAVGDAARGGHGAEVPARGHGGRAHGAAPSPARRANSMPRASSTPRPTRYRSGS